MDETPASLPEKRSHGPGMWLNHAAMVVAAVPLAVFPVMYAWLGFHEIGGQKGWWEPPPASNAGELVPSLAVPSAVVLLGVLAVPSSTGFRLARALGHSRAVALVWAFVSALVVLGGVWLALVIMA